MSNLRNQFRVAIYQASDSLHNSQDWDEEYYSKPTVLDTLLDRLEEITECAVVARTAQLRKRLEDHIDTTIACLQAAGGSEDLDELERECVEAGPKPSCFVRQQFQMLRAQRDHAWQMQKSMQDILEGRVRNIDEVIEDQK